MTEVCVDDKQPTSTAANKQKTYRSRRKDIKIEANERQFNLHIEKLNPQKVRNPSKKLKTLWNQILRTEPTSRGNCHSVEFTECVFKVYRKKRGDKEKLYQEFNLSDIMTFNSYDLAHNNLPVHGYWRRESQLMLYSREGLLWQLTGDPDKIKNMEKELRQRVRDIRKHAPVKEETYEIAFTGIVADVESLNQKIDERPGLVELPGQKQFLLKSDSNSYQIVMRELYPTGQVGDGKIIINKNQVYSMGYDKHNIKFNLLGNSPLGSVSFKVSCSYPNIIELLVRPFFEKERRGRSGVELLGKTTFGDSERERALRAREWTRISSASLPQYIDLKHKIDRIVANSLEASAKSKSSPEALSLNDSGVPQSQ